MIILFSLKINKFHHIGVMISWKWFVVVFSYMIMCYYWLNKEELFQKVNDRNHNGGGKERPVKYVENNGVLKLNAINRYRNSWEEGKEAKKKYGISRYRMTKNKKAS